MKYYNNDDSASVTKVKELLDIKYSANFKRTKEFSVFDLRDEQVKMFAEIKKKKQYKR